MLFANYIQYINDQDAIAAIRPTHRKYLKGLLDHGQLAAAGPFRDGSGALFIYRTATLESAQDLAAADPYTLGGVIREQTIHPWHLVYSRTEYLNQPPAGT